MPDIAWIEEGHRLRLGEHEYVLAADYERLKDSLATLTQRHNHLKVNLLRQQLKKNRRLQPGERHLLVRSALADQARAILQSHRPLPL